jgi:hypothetical protein
VRYPSLGSANYFRHRNGISLTGLPGVHSLPIFRFFRTCFPLLPESPISPVLVERKTLRDRNALPSHPL